MDIRRPGADSLVMSAGDYRQRVGARIRRAREAAGLSQTQLAQRVGVADKQVSRWEHGQQPRPGRLEAIADALGVPAESFFRDD